MSESSLPVFVETQPKISIKDGHVYVTADVTYVWTPHAFRAFIEHGRRLLDQWQERQRAVTPIKKRG